jgi:hypothetical protein
MLFEGAVVGALIDGRPQVARIARHLAVVALAATVPAAGPVAPSGPAGPSGPVAPSGPAGPATAQD